MKPTLTLIPFVLVVVAIGTSAFGHAFVDHADPRVGSTVSKAPAVHIWFTQEPEPAFSRIEVYNSDGKQVDNKDTRADDKDAKELIVSLPDLPAGTYKVIWHVLSVDTHKTQGDFKFSVKPEQPVAKVVRPLLAYSARALRRRDLPVFSPILLRLDASIPGRIHGASTRGTFTTGCKPLSGDFFHVRDYSGRRTAV
jgi:copper resistance protein C